MIILISSEGIHPRIPWSGGLQIRRKAPLSRRVSRGARLCSFLCIQRCTPRHAARQVARVQVQPQRFASVFAARRFARELDYENSILGLQQPRCIARCDAVHAHADAPLRFPCTRVGTHRPPPLDRIYRIYLRRYALEESPLPTFVMCPPFDVRCLRNTSAICISACLAGLIEISFGAGGIYLLFCFEMERFLLILLWSSMYWVICLKTSDCQFWGYCIVL